MTLKLSGDHKRRRSCSVAATALVVGSIATVVCYLIFFFVNTSLFRRPSEDQFSKRLTWSDGEKESEVVALRILQQSTHYGLGTGDWSTLFPSGQHIVYVDGDEGAARPHSVTLFHQLRCLEVLQREYADDTRHIPSPLANHCFNYLRQLILCQMDVRAEAQFMTPRREGQETICRDWTAVYQQAEQNYALYSSRT